MVWLLSLEWRGGMGGGPLLAFSPLMSKEVAASKVAASEPGARMGGPVSPAPLSIVGVGPA